MPTQNKKPVIFLAFANVRDDSVDYLRNLPDEQRQIREALEKVRVTGLCEIVERPNTTTKVARSGGRRRSFCFIILQVKSLFFWQDFFCI